MNLKRQFAWVFLLVTLVSLTACEIVDLDEKGKPIIPVDPNKVIGFEEMSPEEIVKMIWQSDVIPAVETQSLNWKEIGTLQQRLTESQSEHHFVALHGEITDVNNSMTSGYFEVSQGEQKIHFQAGRIIKGNAIRDSSEFLKFDDFKNQVQFAKLSRAFNKTALANVPIVSDPWIGQQVTVYGAATITPDEIIHAVPILLQGGIE